MKKQVAATLRHPKETEDSPGNPDVRLFVPPGRRVFTRKGGLRVRKKTFCLEEGLCLALGTYAVQNGMDEQDVVAIALRGFLGRE